MKRMQFLASVVILAISACGTPTVTLPGKAPVIQSMSVESGDVRVGAGIKLMAQATADSKALSYAWSSSGGMITMPKQAKSIWLAPTSVPYTPYPVTIVLTVTDAHGRTDKQSAQVLVRNQGLATL